MCDVRARDRRESSVRPGKFSMCRYGEMVLDKLELLVEIKKSVCEQNDVWIFTRIVEISCWHQRIVHVTWPI